MKRNIVVFACILMVTLFALMLVESGWVFAADSGGYGQDSGGYGQDSGGYGSGDSGGYGQDSGGYGQ